MSDFLDAGRLEDHPFPALAGLLFREGRTGALTLESAGRSRTVWFLGGNPVAVVSSDPQDHISRFLLEHGRIGGEEADRLAAIPETRDGLAAADFVPKDALNWGVKFRFVNLCYDLFRWQEGDYSFREEQPPRELFQLKVPAHTLVFKGVGYLGKGTLVDLVPESAVLGPGAVSPDDARYLGPAERSLLDGCRPGRSVAEVLAGNADDPDHARQILYALSCLGLVSLSGPGAAVPVPELDEPGFTLEGPAGAPIHEAPEADSFTLPDVAADATDAFHLPPLESVAGGADLGSSGAAAEAAPYSFDDASFPGSFAPLEMTPSAGDDRAAPAPAAARKQPTGGRRLPHLPRVAGIALGAIAAAAVIGAAGWWWLGGSEAPPAPVKPSVNRPAKTPAAAPVAAPVPPQEITAPPAAPAAPPAPVAAPVATPAPQQAQAPRPVGGNAGDRHRSGLEVFRAGDLDGAAAIWEDVLSDTHPGAFTVALMTACEGENIREAQRALAPQDLYLVSKKVNGRLCFRVCLGAWPTRDEAAQALAALPAKYRAEGAQVKPVADVLKR